jgi:hypothetical protein
VYANWAAVRGPFEELNMKSFVIALLCVCVFSADVSAAPCGAQRSGPVRRAIQNVREALRPVNRPANRPLVAPAAPRFQVTPLVRSGGCPDGKCPLVKNK